MRVAISVMVGVALLLGKTESHAWAAQPRRGDMGVAAKAAMGEMGALVEKDLTSRMLRRPEIPQERRTRLEVEIDLRMLARAMYRVAETAPAGSELQVGANLRARLILEAAGQIEAALDKQPGGQPTAAQAETVAALHRLTYVEHKSLKEVEDTSRKMAGVVLGFAGPAGAEVGKLPVVRPKPTRDAGASEHGPETVPTTLAGLSDAIPKLNVSVMLRQQLTALATQAGSPRGVLEKDKERESAAATQALAEAVELARGLQANTAVSPEARSRLETQLAEGIALFLDQRTRGLAQERFAALGAYRQTVGRIARLGLPPEQLAQLSALFAWARENPEQGGKLMGAIEKGAGARARFDARRGQTNTIVTLRRSVEEIEKQFSVASGAFNAALLESAKATTPRVADIEQQAEEMRRIGELLARLDQMPAVIDALAVFKPKPGNGLERRVSGAAVALSTASSTPKAKEEAMQTLGDLQKLAELAGILAKVDISKVSPTVERKCAGGKLTAVGDKWRALAAELASQAAGGQEMDAKKLERVGQAQVLYDAVKQATALEAALMDDGVLGRWVDWRMGPDELKPLFMPYQQAMAEAFTGYVSDAPGAVESWVKAEKRYRPVVSLMIRAGSYKEQCAAFPGTGVMNVAACLATPVEGAGFGTERLTGFCMEVYRERAEAGDAGGAEEVLGGYFKRVGGE